MIDRPWLAQAKRLESMGIVEIPGKRHNADIMFMAKTLNVWYPSDETAWCGLFVAYCLKKAGVKDSLPKNILGARQWKSYGTEVKAKEVSPGDILVFWRGSPKGSYGHVGFYIAETETAYKVLGGNQGNTISEVWVAKSRLLGIRRPTGYKSLGPVKVGNTKAHNLSTNEG